MENGIPPITGPEAEAFFTRYPLQDLTSIEFRRTFNTLWIKAFGESDSSDAATKVMWKRLPKYMKWCEDNGEC
jgi:hypothetical protein